MTEEESGSPNSNVKDLEFCNKILKSDRFKGLVPIIVLMDQKNYYRINDIKNRTAKSVFKILEKAEVNCKLHEAGVLKNLFVNLKQWTNLLAVASKYN